MTLVPAPTPLASDPVSDPLEQVLAQVDGWGAEHAAAAVVGPRGVLVMHGDATRPFRWASVTKLLTAWTVLGAADRGLLALDDPAGPEGASVRHLLAHASGLPFEGAVTLAPPGRRRIYSNPGYDLLGALVALRSGSTFEDVLRSTVLEPLGMRATTLLGRPSEGLHGPLADIAAFGRELLRPTLLQPATAAAATAVAFPGLVGVLPGVGRFDPLDWGLGPEVRSTKTPHWTGHRNSPGTVGHFGGAGTFLWADPAADIALVCLTDRDFDTWALDAWPRISDAVVEAAGSRSVQAAPRR